MRKHRPIAFNITNIEMQTKDTHAKRDYRDKIILDYHFILDLIIDYFMTLIMVLLAKFWQAGKKMR